MFKTSEAAGRTSLAHPSLMFDQRNPLINQTSLVRQPKFGITRARYRKKDFIIPIGISIPYQRRRGIVLQAPGTAN